MKAQLTKGAAILSAAAAVSLLQALPASAYTIDGSAITFDLGSTNELFTVEFDGPVAGISSKTNVELVSFVTQGSQNVATFIFQLFNTTSAPLSSRVSVLGFNVNQSTDDVSVSGGFTQVGSGNVPGLGGRDICFKNTPGFNCAGGGGTGPLNGQNITFEAVLDFASSVDTFTLDNFFVRYQAISGAGSITSGVGEGTPIPTPALLPGLVGLGVAALRKRSGATEDQEAA